MAQADGGSKSGYTAEELARDESQPRRELGNAWAALCDINRDELTDREKSRLDTIQTKIDELESIIEEREVQEWESRL